MFDEEERRASEEYIQRLLAEEEQLLQEERRRREDDERLAKLLSDQLVSVLNALPVNISNRGTIICRSPDAVVGVVSVRLIRVSGNHPGGLNDMSECELDSS